VDLHVHTTASDGTDTSAAVVRSCIHHGVSIVAVTDHDTLDGIPAAVAAGTETGVTVLPGIEISAGFEGQSIHILGLGIGRPDRSFQEMLHRIREGRTQRNPRIIQKLRLLGFGLTEDDVSACAGGDILGRLHIAKAMVNRGFVDSIDDAFTHYLVRGGRAYVERYRPDAADAITRIREIGGVPVLAHPGLMRYDGNPARLSAWIGTLKSMGIEAIETHYYGHTEAVFKTLRALAETHDLLESGGSDYHGIHKTSQLGRGCVGRPVTAGFVAPLLKRLAQSAAGVWS